MRKHPKFSVQVKIVEFNPSTPFKDQIEIIADTGVFISVHTSNLANAQFLKPGSAVFEIVQRNWAWADMDRSFKVNSDLLTWRFCITASSF